MPAGSTDAPGALFCSHTKNARAVASSINAMCEHARPDAHGPKPTCLHIWSQIAAADKQIMRFYLALRLGALTVHDWQVEISQSLAMWQCCRETERIPAWNWAAAANKIGAQRRHGNVFLQKQRVGTVYIPLFWPHEVTAFGAGRICDTLSFSNCPRLMLIVFSIRAVIR